ncbi:hypothetical protein NMY22_g3568 [Coprinellus aureogranulatus]|nr:hypothetical protein NMY22_g3568 [Coprinellus aureogranulatus]
MTVRWKGKLIGLSASAFPDVANDSAKHPHAVSLSPLARILPLVTLSLSSRSFCTMDNFKVPMDLFPATGGLSGERGGTHWHLLSHSFTGPPFTLLVLACHTNNLAMGRREELRIGDLNLPDEIVAIARTYRDLPPEARVIVEEAVARYQRDVSRVEDSISSLVLPRDYYIRQDLRVELDVVRASLRACQGLLSTMHRIPFETMGEIFGYYLADGGSPPPLDEDDSDEEEMDGKEEEERFRRRRSPGLLCLVCRHWKTIAIGTPSLWSNIKIKVYHEAGGPDDAAPLVIHNHVLGVLTWMDRVTSHPWTLTRVDGNQSDVSKPWIKNFRLDGAVPLTQLVHRRASAYITRLTVFASDTAIGLGHLVCPKITSVVSFSPHGISTQPSLLGLPVMDNLEEAVLWARLPGSLPTNIPWSKLTRLFLGVNVFPSQWKSIIWHCTSLQRGIFYMEPEPDDNEVVVPRYPSPSNAILPYLKDLTFLVDTPFHAPIDGLSLPALTTLKVFTGWAEPRFDAQPELFNNLTHLTLLQHGWMMGEEAVSIFSKMPQLTELLFRLCGGFDGLFDFMTYGREEKYNLRLLKALGIYLVVRDPHEEQSDDEEGEQETFPHHQIVSLVESRTEAIRRGDFSRAPYSLSPLEHFVLRPEAYFNLDEPRNREWIDDTIAAVRDGLRSYGSSCGIQVSVFGATEECSYSNSSVFDPPDHILFPSTFNASTRQNEVRLAHWDEGFADPLDNLEEYSLRLIVVGRQMPARNGSSYDVGRLTLELGQINQGGNFYEGAHNFSIGIQHNIQNVTNNVTNVVKSLELQDELDCLHEATHIRNRLTAPPDSICLPGTRKKLIKQIKTWVNSGILLKGVPSHVLWLYGYVGCGKSAIAQTIAETFSQKKRLVGSFFFFRSTEERSKPNRFPTTMASQMVANLPLTKLFVEDAWKTYRSSLASTPVHVQFLHLFLNPFQSALRSPGRRAQSLLSGPYLTVIDGLDECQDRQGIAALIEQINSFFSDNPHFPLRFFISSRVEEHIRHRLKPDHTQLISLVDETTEEEIAYIVDELFKMQQSTIGFYSLMGIGQFILEPTDDGRTPKERLAMALDHKRGLDEVYAEVLSRSEKHRYFGIIISTLALSRAQHSIAALAQLLGIEPGDVILVLQNLHAILYIPDDDHNPVTFCHSSLGEFLVFEGRAKRYFAAPSHHRLLAYRYYANMDVANDIPSHDRLVDTAGNFRYHWSTYIAPSLGDPPRLKEELCGLLTHIRRSTSPTKYPSLLFRLATFALLDRVWIAKVLPRSRRPCQVEELVMRITHTRTGTNAWYDVSNIFGAILEVVRAIETKLRAVNLSQEFLVLYETDDAQVSPADLPLLSYHTPIALTCMEHLFHRSVSSQGATGLKTVLMPRLDEPIRSHHGHTELARHVSGYSFWSFGIHLVQAFEHDPGVSQSHLTSQRKCSNSAAPREDQTAFEFLLSQRDYHVGFGDPGDYLPLFKANFSRASSVIEGRLSPGAVESFASAGKWGFASVPRQNGNGNYWAYGSFEDDFSILNIWIGYRLLAECLIAKMEKTHDDTTLGSDELHGPKRITLASPVSWTSETMPWSA